MPRRRDTLSVCRAMDQMDFPPSPDRRTEDVAVPVDMPAVPLVASEGQEFLAPPEEVSLVTDVLPAAVPDLAPRESAWIRVGRELMSGVQTLLSAAVYATLIVTFGFQVARVDGLSMAPTLEDHDRL